MTARARLALAVMALLALVAVVYAPARHGVFIWDDHSLIVGNKLVEDGTATEIFARPFAPENPLTHSRPIYYRPLTVTSLRADHALATLDARQYHVTNVLLHLCATMTLLFAARRLGAHTFAAVACAAAWALFPRSTECVAWVSGRADLLAALFALAAIALWPWLGRDGAEPRAARARAILAGAALLSGLLAKEVAAAAVLALVIGTTLGARGDGSERVKLVLRRLAYVAVPTALYALLRWRATRGVSSHIAPLGAGLRAKTALEAVGRYVEMTFDPWHPTSSIGLLGELDARRALLGGTVLAACIVLATRRMLVRRRSSEHVIGTRLAPDVIAIATATTFGLVALALVLHVVPIVLVSAVVADRLLYVPLAGLALGLAVASARLSPRARTVAAAAVLALTASFVPITRARAADYTDEIRFRVVAAEHAHPHNPSAKSALANVLRSSAEFELAGRLHASAARTLAEMGPPAAARYGRSLENLAGCYEMLGDYDAAAEVYRRLLTLRPDNARVHVGIAFLFMHAFSLDDAEASLRRALALDPTLEPAKSTLASLPSLRGEVARLASADARKANALAWARLLTRLGRIEEATAAWLDIALDRRLDDDVAYRAVEFLVSNADIATARRAADAFAQRAAFEDRMAHDKFARRARDQVTIDALRPRLEALAAE